MSGRNTNYLAPWIWVVYLALFTLAIPWYWPDEEKRMLFGFPLWVAVSVGGSFLISCFTAWLFLFRWPASTDEEGEK